MSPSSTESGISADMGKQDDLTTTTEKLDIKDKNNASSQYASTEKAIDSQHAITEMVDYSTTKKLETGRNFTGVSTRPMTTPMPSSTAAPKPSCPRTFIESKNGKCLWIGKYFRLPYFIAQRFCKRYRLTMSRDMDRKDIDLRGEF